MTEYNDKYDQDLISILAHDLRTPINSTRHFVDLAYHAGQQGNEELHEKYTERAQQGLDRMARLINDVLEMSRLEQDDGLQVEPCDLTMQVRECVGLLEGAALERDVTLKVDLPDALPLVEGDPNRLQQVINNLMGNAIKYNRDGGTVTVSGDANETTVTLRVADTGYGIPAGDMERIFEPFYRSKLGKERKIEGSGLGLAIANKIVERHGGTLTVESEEGAGTTFTLRLRKQLPPTD